MPGKAVTRLLIVFSIFTAGLVLGLFVVSLQVEPEPVAQMQFHTGSLPLDRGVFSVYESGGVVMLISSTAFEDGRILPYNIYGGPVPYDLLVDPKGWTDIPAGLLEILR